MKHLIYKCHNLTINEIPNFHSREDRIYRGTSTIDSKEWTRDSSSIDFIVNWFKSKIDNLYRGMTFEQVCKEWGGNWKKLIYKDRPIYLDIKKRVEDNKVVYLGGFYTKEGNYNGVYRTIESIHYDKVVSKFEKFVDEYCTNWKEHNTINYKGFILVVKKELGVDNYFGTCQIHKNSTFKRISKSVDKVVEDCKTRIDQVIKYKEKVKMNPLSSKQEKIVELEQAIARLSSQLEELKKEKDTYVYKGVTLEYGKEEGLEEGYMIGRIKNAPKDTNEFYRKVASNMKVDFEEYVDELEESAKLYLKLTGQEISKGELELYP